MQTYTYSLYATPETAGFMASQQPISKAEKSLYYKGVITKAVNPRSKVHEEHLSAIQQSNRTNRTLREEPEVYFMLSADKDVLEQSLACATLAILEGRRPPTCVYGEKSVFAAAKLEIYSHEHAAHFYASIGCPSTGVDFNDIRIIGPCMAGGYLERMKHQDGEKKDLTIAECYELIEKLKNDTTLTPSDRNWKIVQIITYIAFFYIKESLEAENPQVPLSALYPGTKIHIGGHGLEGYDGFFTDPHNPLKHFTSAAMVARFKQADLSDGMIFNLLQCHAGASFSIKDFRPATLAAAALADKDGNLPLLEHFFNALIKGGFQNVEIIGAAGGHMTYPHLNEVTNEPEDRQSAGNGEFRNRFAVSRTISLKEKIFNSSDDELRSFGYTDEKIAKINELRPQYLEEKQKYLEELLEELIALSRTVDELTRNRSTIIESIS